MARKPTTTRSLENDVERELEEALDINFSDEEIDLTASMEELEAQISMAADELAREGRGDAAVAAAKAAVNDGPKAAITHGAANPPKQAATEYRPAAPEEFLPRSLPASRRPMTIARRTSPTPSQA